jgi:hypothetical protein
MPLIMAAEPDWEEMLFDFSSQSQHEDEWNNSDEEVLDAFQGDDDANPPYTSEEYLDDFSMLISDSPGAACNRTESGSAVPNRYCLAALRASVPNLRQGRRHLKD